MPTYRIELDDGKVFDVESADESTAMAALGLGATKTEGGFAPRSAREAEATPEQDAAARREMDIGYRSKSIRESAGSTNDIVQKLPLVGDIAAGLQAPIRMAQRAIQGKPQVGFGEEFSREREAQRRAAGDFQNDNPILSGFNTVGGLALIGAPKLGAGGTVTMPAAQSAGAAAATNAGIGAAYGVSEGDTVAERLQNALMGGALGGAAGYGATKLADKVAGAAARPAAPVATNGVVEAGDALGVNVPRILATDSKVVQAAGAAGRQSPFGGPKIESAAQQFLDDLGGASERVANRAAGRAADAATVTADEVGSGIRNAIGSAADRNSAAARGAEDAFRATAPAATAGERGVLGEDVLAGLSTSMERNRAAQSAPYDQLRRTLINADQAVSLDQGLGRTLNGIMRARTAAGEAGLPRDLNPIAELATNPRGATFNGLQRARNTLAQRIDFEAGQGFDVGDLKRAYGAVTQAMRSAVQQSARNGAGPAALGAFERAEANFGRLADANRSLSGFTKSGPESLVDRVVRAASDKSGGSIRTLTQLRQNVPKDVWQRMGRHAFDQLGRGSDGAFSAEVLAKNWATMSDAGKRALFGQNAGRIDAAVRNLGSVNSRMAGANAEFARMLSGTDTQVTERFLAMASSGSKSDIETLRRFSTVFGQDHLKGLSGVAIARMGKNQKGEFSGAFFEKNWSKLSPEGKALLFSDPEVRQGIDNLLTLTKAEQRAAALANHSNTGRVGITGGFFAGIMMDPMTAIAGAVGAEAAGRYLSQPATIKQASQWTQRIKQASAAGANGTKQAQRATGIFAGQLAQHMGMPEAANDIAAKLMGAPSRAAAGSVAPAKDDREEN